MECEDKIEKILERYKMRYRQVYKGFSEWDDGYLSGLRVALNIFGYTDEKLKKIRRTIKEGRA